MGIGLIIVAVSAGLAILYSAFNMADIAPAVITPALSPFIALIDKFFFFLVAILPLLMAVIPLYILRKRESHVLSIYGVLFGVGLMLMVMGFGLDVKLIDLFQTSWYGSTIGTAGSIGVALGPVGDTLGAILYGLSYWIWGVTLAIVDTAMGGLSSVGDLAYENRWRIKRKRKEHYKNQEKRV